MFINEIGYASAADFVEVAGPAGTGLGDWSIVLYNGADGSVYDTISLSGSIPNQKTGFGSISFRADIQSGAADGLALVSADGCVLQLLSYQGTFTAATGPAANLVSADIGVFVTDSASPRRSLRVTDQSAQLTGAGSQYSSFTWTTNTESPGTENIGQILQLIGTFLISAGSTGLHLHTRLTDTTRAHAESSPPAAIPIYMPPPAVLAQVEPPPAVPPPSPQALQTTEQVPFWSSDRGRVTYISLSVSAALVAALASFVAFRFAAAKCSGGEAQDDWDEASALSEDNENDNDEAGGSEDASDKAAPAQSATRKTWYNRVMRRRSEQYRASDSGSDSESESTYDRSSRDS